MFYPYKYTNPIFEYKITFLIKIFQLFFKNQSMTAFECFTILHTYFIYLYFIYSVLSPIKKNY